MSGYYAAETSLEYNFIKLYQYALFVEFSRRNFILLEIILYDSAIDFENLYLMFRLCLLPSHACVNAANCSRSFIYLCRCI